MMESKESREERRFGKGAGKVEDLDTGTGNLSRKGTSLNLGGTKTRHLFEANQLLV